MNKDFASIYNNEEYGSIHEDWHLKDTDAKVNDLNPFLGTILSECSDKTIRIADIGSGIGGVLKGVKDNLSNLKNVNIDASAYEISSYASKLGQEKYPDLKWNNGPVSEKDGPFDLIMFIDVLEHLENPWEMLRLGAKVGKYMLVRQPLLDNFSNYRTNNYTHQREHWGHISYFNYRSFMDMCSATSWKPVHVNLLAPWELNTEENLIKIPYWKKLLIKKYRVPMSFVVSGFYLNGLFKSS